MLVLSGDILDKLRGFYFVVLGRFCGNRFTASLSTEQELSHNTWWSASIKRLLDLSNDGRSEDQQLNRESRVRKGGASSPFRALKEIVASL